MENADRNPDDFPIRLAAEELQRRRRENAEPPKKRKRPPLKPPSNWNKPGLIILGTLFALALALAVANRL